VIKSLLKRIFKPAPQKNNYVIAQLNDKIMPIDRGDVYEDPLDSFLKLKYFGQVTGGGTLLMANGENEYCDLEIEIIIKPFTQNAINEIISKLEELGAPKGSQLIIEQTGQKIPFGKLEGMAVYLDGVNLSDEVYKNSDTETIAEKIRSLAGINSDVLRYWQGNTETALYFYATSFNEMKSSISELLKTDPECENARVVQIA